MPNQKYTYDWNGSGGFRNPPVNSPTSGFEGIYTTAHFSVNLGKTVQQFQYNVAWKFDGHMEMLPFLAKVDGRSERPSPIRFFHYSTRRYIRN